jgi:hypothetical protein
VGRVVSGICVLLLALSALSMLLKRRDWRARLAAAEVGEASQRGQSG